MEYFISDTHFGHKNIITYDQRPFTFVEEMDAVMIKKWNERVTKKDVVYILGDFSWHRTEKTIEILQQLNGRKRLIRGNHDRVRSAAVKKYFESIKDYDEIKIGDQKIILCHYSMPFYNSRFSGAILFHGHTHRNDEHLQELKIEKQLHDLDIPCLMYNVGAMQPYMDYTPRTMDEIVAGKTKYMEELIKGGIL